MPQTMHIGVTQTESSKCVLNFILSKLLVGQAPCIPFKYRKTNRTQIVGILLVDLGLGTQN